MARTKTDPDRVVIGTVTATPMRERGTNEEGRRYWRARTMPDRRTVWSGWATRAEVETIAADLVRRGIPSPRPAREVARTVADVLDRWTQVIGERLQAGEIADRTHKVYRTQVGHWKGAIGDVLATALTRELVEDTLRTWRASGAMSPRTAKLSADVLATAVAWGAPRGLVPSVDLSGLAPAAVDDEEHEYASRTPTRAEVARVLRQIPEGRNRYLIELLSIVGARVGEVGALTVASYDRARGELHLTGRDRRRARRGKVATRAWPVIGRLGDLLEELVAPGGELRPPDAPLIDGLTLNVAELSRRVLEGACDAAGVERFTAHGLRRLVAMELVDECRSNLKGVSRLTGHSVAVLMRHYVRPTDESIREIVSRATRGRGRRALQLVGAQNPGTDGEDRE